MRSVADKIGVDNGNLSRKLKNNDLTAEQVIAISYALEVDPVASLAETGFLRENEADTPEEIQARITADLKRLSDAWNNRLAAHGCAADHFNRQPKEEDNLVEFPQNNLYEDQDDADGMPEDAVAYDGREWIPDDDY